MKDKIDLFLGSPHIFYLILAAQKALTNMSRSLFEKAFSAFSLKWLRDEVFSNVISEGDKVKDLLDVTAHEYTQHFWSLQTYQKYTQDLVLAGNKELCKIPPLIDRRTFNQ